VSGCTPSISGLTVTVASGVIHLADGMRKEISASTVVLNNADSTNPRIDLVYIDTTGAVAKITGTAAASPSAPALPSNGISVAQVSVGTNATTGAVNRVQTIAPNLASYGVINVTDFGAKGDGVDCTGIVSYILNQNPYGCRLYFPQGEYTIGNINITYKVEIFGAGLGKTIFKHNSSGNMFENGTNQALFSIHDLTLVGNGNYDDVAIFVAQNTGGNTANDNYMTNIVPATEHAQAKYNHFYNLFITEFGTGIFSQYYNFYTYVDHINIYSCNIGIRNVNTDSMFSKIEIERCTEYGVWESGSSNKWSDLKITWCQGNLHQYGAFYLSGNKNSVVNVETQENYWSGFYITGNCNQLCNCNSDGNNVSDESVLSTYGFYSSGQNYLGNCMVSDRGNHKTSIPLYVDDTTNKGKYDVKYENVDTASNVITDNNIYTVGWYNAGQSLTIKGNLITKPYYYRSLIHIISSDGINTMDNIIYCNWYQATQAVVKNNGGNVSLTISNVQQNNGKVTLTLTGAFQDTFAQIVISGLTNVTIS
jgi:hypothetical protein